MSPRRLGVRVSCALVAVLLISRSSSCTARRPVWRPSTRCSGSFWPALQHAARGRRHSSQSRPDRPRRLVRGLVLDRRADPVLHRGNEREPRRTPRALLPRTTGGRRKCGSTRKRLRQPIVQTTVRQRFDLPQGPTLWTAVPIPPLEVAVASQTTPERREELALRLVRKEDVLLRHRVAPDLGGIAAASQGASSSTPRPPISTAFAVGAQPTRLRRVRLAHALPPLWKRCVAATLRARG
jgi:hypothetical protein